MAALEYTYSLQVPASVGRLNDRTARFLSKATQGSRGIASLVGPQRKPLMSRERLSSPLLQSGPSPANIFHKEHTSPKPVGLL